ncbi:hypothetical protein C7387_1656 [Yokenella regensburgei]|uniref:TRAP transporter small permease n=1 Tax=Yokenella regensburgei TaxID=158877 RepID=A0ABX9S293_9ENTR|nr:hypothetical protein [Yokenella regensburgei]RKR64946.1 hypothetical protein C7387_1656 [Yokenella regensburgei]VFS14483.1 Uncharacterised protein [Yokenella regensburgei]
MRKQKIEIPFESNERYYNGLRNIMSSSIYSTIGVIFYAFLLGKLNFESHDMPMLLTIGLWFFMSCTIWALSYIRPNRIVLDVGANLYIPWLSKTFEVLCYIILGTFCALLYDNLTVGHGSVKSVAEVQQAYVGFLISGLLLFVCLFLFSSFSIAKKEIAVK